VVPGHGDVGDAHLLRHTFELVGAARVAGGAAR